MQILFASSMKAGPAELGHEIAARAVIALVVVVSLELKKKKVGKDRDRG